jgi:hypothetical protein
MRSSNMGLPHWVLSGIRILRAFIILIIILVLCFLSGDNPHANHVIFRNTDLLVLSQRGKAGWTFFIEHPSRFVHLCSPAFTHPEDKGTGIGMVPELQGFFHDKTGDIPFDLPAPLLPLISLPPPVFMLGNPAGSSPDMSLDEISHSLLMQ